MPDLQPIVVRIDELIREELSSFGCAVASG